MEKVFATAPGDADWAWNDPQTVAYVIRVVELRPTWNALYERFIASHWEADPRAAARDEAAANRAWKKDLETEAALRWNRQPARGRIEEADEDYE